MWSVIYILLHFLSVLRRQHDKGRAQKVAWFRCKLGLGRGDEVIAALLQWLRARTATPRWNALTQLHKSGF